MPYLIYNRILIITKSYRHTRVSYGGVRWRTARFQRFRVTLIEYGSLVLPCAPPIRSRTCERHHQHAPRDGELASDDDEYQNPLQFPETPTFHENSLQYFVNILLEVSNHGRVGHILSGLPVPNIFLWKEKMCTNWEWKPMLFNLKKNSREFEITSQMSFIFFLYHPLHIKDKASILWPF